MLARLSGFSGMDRVDWTALACGIAVAAFVAGQGWFS
jgi:hypothetical protein